MAAASPRRRARAEQVLRRLGPVAGAPLLAPAAVAALPFWAVARMTRALAGEERLGPSTFSSPVVDFAPVVGVRPRPGLDGYAHAQDAFHLTTDDDGWRGPGSLDDADVIVLGDSFAFGWGVDDDQVLTRLDDEWAAKAVACPGYSMVHGVLWLARLADRLGGRTVVWMLYLGNDLSDNLCPNVATRRMPFVRHDPGVGWEVVTDHVSPEPWTADPTPRDDLRRFAELSTPSAYHDRVFSAADHLIGRAQGACTAAGARLVVVTVPPREAVRNPEGVASLARDPGAVDVDLADRTLAASCGRRGILFLPLRARLDGDDYFDDDMHWNARGHRAAASALREVLSRPAP